MAYEREVRVPTFRDANKLFEKHPHPFNNAEVNVMKHKVSVTVEHSTQGLEPVFTSAEAQTIDGVTTEHQVFSVLRDATNFTSQDVHLLTHTVNEDNSTEVRLMDADGILWRSTGDDFTSASLNGLGALRLAWE